MSTMSPAACTKPSVTRNPAASSRSSPGVRMTTATLWPSTRISRGSSTARRSLPSAPPEPSIRCIATSLTRQTEKERVFTQHHSTVCTVAKFLLGRHNNDLVPRDRVESRFIDVKMRHHQLRRGVGQPLGEGKVLIVAALEHFQEDQVRVTCILNVMQQRFL